MSEVLEAKIRQPARLLSLTQANLKPLGVTGKGDGVSLRCRCLANTRASLVDSGTSLQLPFLVSGRNDVMADPANQGSANKKGSTRLRLADRA